MQWVPIIFVAFVGVPMALFINYMIWFKLLPMIWRMYRDQFRRIREQRKIAAEARAK